MKKSGQIFLPKIIRIKGIPGVITLLDLAVLASDIVPHYAPILGIPVKTKTDTSL